MKNTIKLSLALLSAIATFTTTSCNSSDKEATMKPAATQEKSLRHIVMFQFKADATPEQVKAIEDAFSQLPSKIDTITGYEWGTDVSTENKAQGFTHCFIISFKDQAGLDTYSPHPAHLAFVEILKPSLEKVLVLDFHTQ